MSENNLYKRNRNISISYIVTCNDRLSVQMCLRIINRLINKVYTVYNWNINFNRTVMERETSFFHQNEKKRRIYIFVKQSRVMFSTLIIMLRICEINGLKMIGQKGGHIYQPIPHVQLMKVQMTIANQRKD